MKSIFLIALWGVGAAWPQAASNCQRSRNIRQGDSISLRHRRSPISQTHNRPHPRRGVPLLTTLPPGLGLKRREFSPCWERPRIKKHLCNSMIGALKKQPLSR